MKLRSVTNPKFSEPQKPTLISVDLMRLREVLHAEPHAARRFVENEVGDKIECGETAQPALIPASILFPIVLHALQPTVLLTRRSAQLKDHAGQISFPGGRAEAEDSSPAHTALREAEEEVGLQAKHIEIVGYLPECLTGTGFRVTPVVAFVAPPFELRPDTFEVAEIFEVPLAFLLDPANHQSQSFLHHGKLRHTYVINYGDYFIWGATAGMIVSLYETLAEQSGQ